MKYDSQDPKDVIKSDAYYSELKRLGKQFELKEIKITRSNLQNRALHLYYKLIRVELNELGHEFNYDGLNGNSFSMRYTDTIVKELIWRPIQEALFGFKSTTKLNSLEINEIIDVITKFFGEKGVVLEFPCYDSLMSKQKAQSS